MGYPGTPGETDNSLSPRGKARWLAAVEETILFFHLFIHPFIHSFDHSFKPSLSCYGAPVLSGNMLRVGDGRDENKDTPRASY